MSRTTHCLLLVISSLLPAARTYAINNDSGLVDRDYKVIVERNPFGLKPPPPPPTNAPAKETPKDEILLTGITSIGELNAYFMTKPPQNKPAEYYRMRVGDEQDGLEVLEIDPAAKSVRVRKAGVETVMTFASHGVKPPATPSPTNTPALPGAKPGTLPLPGAASVTPGATPTAGVSPGTPANTGSGRIRQIPSRTRTGQQSFTPGVEAGAAMAAPAVAPPNPNAPLQDALMMELQRKSNPNIVFPPTPMPVPGR